MITGSIAGDAQATVFLSGASASVEDWFTLTGTAPGVSVNLIARLRIQTTGPVSGIDLADVSFSASLREGASPPAEFFRRPHDSSDFPPQTYVDTTLTVAVAALPSQPFQLTYTTSVGVGQTMLAQTRGTLDFADLPAEARLTSCGGYEQGAPVPVRSSSWGSLKLRYR